MRTNAAILIVEDVGTAGSAVEAIRLGAFDRIAKSFSTGRLTSVVKEAL